MSDPTPAQEQEMEERRLDGQIEDHLRAAAVFDGLEKAMREFADTFGCKEMNGDLRCGLMEGHRDAHEARWTVSVPTPNHDPF